MSITFPATSHNATVKFGRAPVETAAQSTAQTIEQQLAKLSEKAQAKTDVLVKSEAPDAAAVAGADARKAAVWVTSEREPARAGGLGVVSQTIPWALARKGHDIRIVVPYLKPMQEEDLALKRTGKAAKAFKPTGLTITLHIPDHGPNSKDKFDVLQRFEAVPEDANKPVGQQRGNYVYAIKNNKYFSGNDLYTYTASKAPAASKTLPLVDSDPSFAKNMIFTRVVSKLLSLLEPGAAPKNSTLSTFKQKTDVIIANDWMGGSIFRELAAAKNHGYDPYRLFFFHNHLGGDRPLSHAQKLGMALPTEPSLTRAATPLDDSATLARTEGQYSSLALGIHDAHSVIINKPYATALAKTPVAEGHIFQHSLKEKVEANKISDMHHAPSVRFDPKASPDLKIDGFRQWNPEADPTMAAFKKANKQALQATLGLKKDPDAVIMTWIARMEPRQKGFNMLRDSMIESLKQHPNLQYVIWGKSNESDKATIDALRQQVAKDPELRGRLHMPNSFASGKESKKLTQSYAGSDFVILPSMWEPYGLTQLEAKSMGTIPLVHSLDGIRSSVSDPKWNGAHWIPELNSKPEAAGHNKETVWQYGQTGVMMKPVPVVNYLRSFDRTAEIAATEELLQKAATTDSRQAGLTVGSTEQIGRKAKEALSDEAGAKTAGNDGFKRPAFTDEQRKQLQDIMARLLPAPKPGIEPKALEASKRRFLTPEEQKSLQKDVAALKTIFQQDDMAVLGKAKKQYVAAQNDAMALAADSAKIGDVRKNALKYVNTEHSEEAILNRFYKPAFENMAVAVQ